MRFHAVIYELSCRTVVAAAPTVGLLLATVSCTTPTDMTGPGGLEGTYAFIADGSRMTIDGVPQANGQTSTTTWTITPCGEGCSHIVSSLGWNLDLHLINDTWQGTRELADICLGDDGTKSTVTYEINSSDLTGTVVNYMPCSRPPKTAVVPALLTADP